MENRSNQCNLEEDMTAKGVGETENDVLDTKKYMDIDEFMNVLREVELITPFGKVQEASDTGVPQFDLQTLEMLTDCSRNKSRSGRTKIIPRTPTVMQVLETERTLRDVDTCKLLTYSKQHSEKVVKDSVMTNYRFLLLSEN